MATIPPVSNNELIRTTWGNTVATELNSNTIKNNAAAQTLTGSLLIVGPSGTGTLKLRRTTNNQPAIWFESNAAALYGHIEGQPAGLQYFVEDPTDFHSFLVNDIPRFRIDSTGVDVTGNLAVSGAFTGNINADNIDADDIDVTGDITAANVTASNLIAGATPTGSVDGSALHTNGSIGTTVTTGTVNGLPNIALCRTGVPAGASGVYLRFDRNATQDLVGSITIAAGPQVAYNETSDYRLKNELGPIDDPLGKINALVPKHLAWKDGGAEFDGFIAHEVQAVVPYAVTGDKDATQPDGGIDPQQLDTGKLIALLVGAVQTLSARIDALEGVTT